MMFRTTVILCTLCLAAVIGQALNPSVAKDASIAGLPEPIAVSDYRPFDEHRAALGRLLFYDKILSGNRNISCGTCHNHDLATSDGLSLGIGEGGIGLGPDRRVPEGRDHPNKRVPRNSPALFNLGHRDIRVLFHDGRVSDDDAFGRGFNSPAEEWLPEGLQSVVATQALFPLTSAVEMAGEPEENELAAAGNRRIDYVWPLVTARVAAVPDYVDAFQVAFDDVETAGDVTIVHIANAIDDFINSEWRSHTSAFDRFLAGDASALDETERAGAELFYGTAGCASCHGGPLLTDHDFRALAVPPFGPGRTRKFDPYVRDVGRMAETDDAGDAYRFRTPSLRNVARTGPWGHNGAYASLDAMIRHHLDPKGALAEWDRTQVVMPAVAKFAETDFAVWSDRREMARHASHIDIDLDPLSDDEIAAIVAFLKSLTDPAAIAGRLGKPRSVPSGLPVD